jgi:hypothetical protein
MEAGMSLNHLWVRLKPAAALGLDLFQLIQGGEDPIGWRLPWLPYKKPSQAWVKRSLLMSSTSRAWVRENNPNVYVKGRFDVTHIPTGDPDCRLGVKKSSNQVQPDGSKKVKKVSLFGYGTGVAACTDPVYGEVVLAAYTLPFNRADVS